ncbi:MAG: DUF2905 domain-containing protein [Candidatus Protochlamydia sp.]|nr:DUF2905 domain-containing protein [Candidatus Protochlamydia sp.]
MGKILIIFGFLLIGAGFLLLYKGYIPFLGQLPGDIAVKGENYQFYFPIVTCILLSVIISLLLYFFSK